MSHKFTNLINEEIIYKNNKILCSSGSNYFVIKSDGSVNRCFNDLTNLGDMLEYPNFVRKNATECMVGYKCDASSDQMFCTQWNNPKKKDYYENNPVCVQLKDNDPNNLNLKESFFVIYLTDKCNFDCPYCCNYYPDGIKERPINYNERKTEDWIKFFNILKNNLEIVQLNFNGGEPLLRDDINDILFEAIDYNFNCSIVTNFSVFKNLDKILNKNINNKGNLQFSITLHPINVGYDFNRILKYILLFKEQGYKLRVSLLGWKDNLKYHESYKTIFNEIGIHYWLKWCGGYEYDKDTIDYLIKEGAGKSTAQYLYEENIINRNSCLLEENKIYCNSGYNFFIIAVDGDYYRCFSQHQRHKFDYKKNNLDPEFMNNNIGNIKYDDYIKKYSLEKLFCPYNIECNYGCREGCDYAETIRFNGKNGKSIYINEYAYRLTKTYSIFDLKNEADIFWYITHNCNYNCPYCNEPFPGKSNEELSENDCINIFNKLDNQFDFIHFTFTGGEPTISNKFFTLANLIYHKQDKMNIRILTNMSNYKELKELFLRNWKREKSLQVYASCHFLEKKFDLDKFIELCQIVNSKNFIEISTVNYGEEKEKYLEYHKIFKKLGFNHLTNQYYEPIRKRNN